MINIDYINYPQNNQQNNLTDSTFINNFQQIENNNRYANLLKQEKVLEDNDVSKAIDYNINYNNANIFDTKNILESMNQNNNLQNEKYQSQIYSNENGNVSNISPYSGSINYDKNYSKAEIQRKIVDASNRYGFSDPRVFLAISGAESGFNPKATNNSGSGARGLFQFIPSTWKAFGNGGNVYDPDANIDGAMRLTQANVKTFIRHFGREPTPGEIYLMHFLGTGDGSKGRRSEGAIYALKNPNVVMPSNVAKQNGFKYGATYQQAINRCNQWIYSRMSKY